MPLPHISRLTGCSLVHSGWERKSHFSSPQAIYREPATGSLLGCCISEADRSGQKSKLHRHAGQSSGCDSGASVEGVSLGSEPWAIQAAG